jgi:uncharacterized membrane protein YoaK (UPF0700 family)
MSDRSHQTDSPARPVRVVALHGPSSVIPSILPPILPSILGLIAGSTDTIGFLGLNGLFTAHITGDLVTLAAHFAAGERTIFSHLAALPVFMLMLFLTRLLANFLERTGHSTLQPLLAMETAFLISFLVVCGVWGPWRDPNTILATTAGLLGVAAMAVQNALVQISLAQTPATSVMTTNVTRFVLDLGEVLTGHDRAKAAQARARAIQTFPVILSFATGCALGAAAKVAAGLWSLALPAGLALIALAIASTGPSRARSKSAEPSFGLLAQAQSRDAA